MSQMTLSQARGIDPHLTNIARGYRQQQLVGMALFPQVPVSQRGGRIITFGKEAFMTVANMRRAPGQNTRRIQIGYAGGTFALEDFSLEGLLPIEVEEEAEAVPGIDMQSATVQDVMSIIRNRLEIAQATLSTNAANYAAANKVTKSGTAQWNDYGSTGSAYNSNPVNDIETAKEAIRAATGMRPNTVVMGAAVFSKVKNHPQIVDRIKYTGRDVPTTDLLASLWGVERVLVGESITSTDAGVFSDTWGKFVVVAYTNTATLAARGAPSYGYTYQLMGRPNAEEPYYDRNTKSWIFPVNDSCAPVIAGAEAGYLISAAVA